MSAIVELADLRTQLVEAVDGETPGERVERLRIAQRECGQLAVEIELHIAEALLESTTPEAVMVTLDLDPREAFCSTARDNADIREELVRRGLATPERLDEAGYLSHEALDEAAEAGRLEEVAKLGVTRAWGLGLLRGGAFNLRVRRGRGGTFADRPGSGVKAPRRGPTVGRAQDRPSSSAPGRRSEAPVRRAGAPAGRRSDAEAKRPEVETGPRPDAEIPGRDELGPDGPTDEQLAQVLDAFDDWPPQKGETARAILGEAADTQQMHARDVDGRTVYTAERKVLHDRIITALLGDHQPQDTPTALFMAGGTASGKSTGLRAMPEAVPGDAVHIDPDAIKALLPEYDEMVRARDRYAAFGAHEESSDIAKRLTTEAQALRLNLVIDGTGNSGPGKFAGKVRDVVEAGYTVDLFYVSAPAEVALRRAVGRAIRTGRMVPPKMHRDIHRNVSLRAPEVLEVEGVRNFTMMDTTAAGRAQVFYRREDGVRETAVDQRLFDAFMAKGAEPEPGSST